MWSKPRAGLRPLPRRLATFYSRSRKGRWCKGETSGHYIKASLLDWFLVF